MRETHAVWIAGFLAILVLPWPAVAANAWDDESAVMPEETAAHYARSEIRYGEGWIAVEELFQQYLDTQAEMEGVLEQGRQKRIELDGINRQVYSLRSEAQNKERPLRAEMAKTAADKRKAEAALRASPPAQPKYEPSPPQPSGSQYSSTSNSYNQAMRDWQNEVRRVRDQNHTLKRDYDKRLAAYQQAKAAAGSVIQASQAKVTACQGQLDTLTKELDAALAPFLDKRQALNDTMLALDRQAQALAARADAMVEALRAAPQELLWREDIAEWDGQFRLLTDLRTLHAELQAEIDRMRVELEEAAHLAGRDFPTDWRHPQQDKVDALKALIERAEAAPGT